jgi:predicted Zn-dependent protease
MLRARSRRLWLYVAFGFGVLLAADAAAAKNSAAYLRDAEQYFTNGNLREAEIELRNAIRETPNDPAIRTRLAEVYLQLGNAAAAEREARAAGELGADEKDYLPALTDALLGQQQFGEVLDVVRPGDRDPVLESKLRMRLGVAAAALREW